MNVPTKFPLLQKALRTIGLSQEDADSVIDFILRLLGEKHETAVSQFPYHRNPRFLSPAEHSFCHVLREATADWALVTTKISLGDLFQVRSDDRSQYTIYRNKIDRKHVDFLLLHPQTLQPLLGIELDDKSHLRADRQARDSFVDSVFAAAGLPLVHIPVRHAYPVDKLDALLRQKAGVTTADAGRSLPPQVEAETAVPLCPACHLPMIARTARRGPQAGSRFWGCPNYPQCREIRPFTSP